MKSTKPSKQRRDLYNAPLHLKRKWMSSHLEENLLLKYDKRNLPVIKGDTVKVLRGSYKGHEDKVVHVNVKKQYVEIEGLTLVKADNKKIAKPIHPSNVIITKLNLTDKWRRNKIEKGLSEEAKKEIEKEAEAQIKEIVKEQEKIEEEKRKEEERLAAEETEEKEIPAEEKTEDKTKKKKKSTEKKTTEKPKEKNKKDVKTDKKPVKKSKGKNAKKETPTKNKNINEKKEENK